MASKTKPSPLCGAFSVMYTDKPEIPTDPETVEKSLEVFRVFGDMLTLSDLSASFPGGLMLFQL